MKEKQSFLYLFLFSVFFLVIVSLFPDNAFPETCKQWIAKVVSVQGDVQSQRAGEVQWESAKLNDTYCQGDRLRVLEKSRAAIFLVNGVILRLDQHTSVVFNGVEGKQTSLLDLLRGAVHFFSRWPRALKIHTPFVNGTVEGTEFLVKVDDDKTLLSVFEGQITAENEAGRISLTSGQSVIAERGKAPTSVIIARPRDAVQWALYYPPVVYEHPEDLKEDDPRFYTYRASSLLHVGRVEEAKADIERAMELDPNNSMAFALQSTIAVTQNEKEKALNLAKKSVEADPKSASAYIAFSYTQQGHFDLKGALDSLKDAVNVEPENALAWARLSELQLSFGELDEALKAAHKAVELNPTVTRTHTVLGFAYLTKVKIKESIAAFQKAIELDQAAPLPRLGLGLAKIRKGCLEEGRKEIEIAVSLDPDNSLIRSYLGKAYFEEKQDKMAKDQYAMAEEFDPLDPTHYFYDAIRKQTINRPVEALHDMQKAIELNDNRAIYRSKLLLDSDLAARSASLARIYTDLGFEQLALVEGWKSVNTDPADFSGHRFLADTYASLPRHEIARVSELLQSQLLQPININPVQPHLAESNLFILEGAGPAELSFNEFNPLFNRNRYSLQVSGIVGENGTFGEEIVVAAVKGKASISAGQFHYETDGWRENNDQKQDIYNLFAQVELLPKTSVQAEFRSKDFNRGDLLLLFDRMPSENLREKDEIRSVRFGLHHVLTPRSDVIGSVIYLKGDFSSGEQRFYDFKMEEEGYIAEVQYLFRSERFSIISGAGYFHDNRDTEDSSPFYPTVTAETEPWHKNFYIYSHINLLRNVTFTIGGSADFLKGDIAGETIRRDQFNPKFGLTWNFFPNSILRAAVFRVLNRAIITDQTIEPTHVAGFNQFFNDTEGTKFWRYGIGIDQKLYSQLYGGVEFSRRDMEVPGFNFLEMKLLEGDWEEQLGRAYLYYTPHKWLSLNAEYQYERFERPEEFAADLITNLNTHRIIFGLSFFHPSGFIAKIKPMYIAQDGNFQTGFEPPDFMRPTFEHKEDHFWTVNASIGYRIAKRLGIITIEARNLFDEEFNFQDTDPLNPRIRPERLILAKFTLAF